MAETDESLTTGELSSGRLAAAALAVAGLLLALVGTIWALVRFWELGQARQTTAGETLGTAAMLIASWAGGALLWCLGELVRRIQDLIAVAQPPSAAPASAPAVPNPRPRTVEVRQDAQSHLLEELVNLTREVRDIALLSDAERAARHRREADELVQQLEAEIPALLREHNLQEAHERVQRALRRFPNLPNWQVLVEQVSQARAQFESHDLAVATREIDDLAALGAWDRAADVLRELRRRHPGAERVTELAKRLSLARERATAEERARLLSQAQDATNRRDWRKALELVEDLLTRFPGAVEAHDLRQQLPTLKANVEIHARQEMESAIRDLIKQKRFAEALRIANELISRYPDSPQAHVLRNQLPKLQQRAAQTS